MGLSIPIFVVSNYIIIRKAIRALLEMEQEFIVCGDGAPGELSLAEIFSLKPGVVLMNLTTSKFDGIQLISKMIDHRPEVKLLVLIDYQYKLILPVIKFGAKGLSSTESQPDKLIQAIKRIYQSKSVIDFIFPERIFPEITHFPSLPMELYDLTGREIEVLRLVSDGKNNQEIADVLQITSATVRTHMNNILKKLNLKSRTQAVAFAWKEGLMGFKDYSNHQI